MNIGVLAGLPSGDSSFTQPRPTITNNIQFSYTVPETPSDPYFNYVTLLLSENNITSKEVHFVPFTAAVGQKILSNGALVTYSLAYTTPAAYAGGVLAANGEIHFVPRTAAVGQKISTDGVASTYSLLYTTNGSYSGGVLAPNGDVHFVPFIAPVGQKVSSTGTVSTYSLVYATPSGNTTGAYSFGTQDRNGEIHFAPFNAPVGQKISTNGVVSTYSLVYTQTDAYTGAYLSTNGDVHFIPRSANRGQRLETNGAVSTYSLVYTTSGSYGFGGVIATNGDIHFTPWSAAVGQKFGSDGVVSTYSLIYTTTLAYAGGVLDQNGDAHFIPLSAAVGQKVSSSGTVSTYSLAYAVATAYGAGVLSDNVANNNTFLDNRFPGVAITRNGNVTQGSFSPYGNSWSNYFDGTGDFLSFTGITFNGDFCAEAWIYKTANPTNYSVIFGGSSTGGPGDTGNHQFTITNSGGQVLVLSGVVVIDNGSGTAVANNQWNHVAWVRSGSNCAIFVNGVRQATGTSSTNNSICSRIGDIAGLAGYLPIGYISNVRIVIGSSVYNPSSTTLTVPTAPLTAITNTQLLTCQSNRFIDNSTNNLTITRNGDVSVQEFSPFSSTTEYSVSRFGGSGYFDGTTDWLNIASSANLTPSGDFTIEFWAYPLTIAGTQEWYSKGYGIQIYTLNSGQWGAAFSNDNSANYYINANFGGFGGFRTNAWQHIVVTRSGNNYFGFVNGVGTSLGTINTAPATGNDVLRIGDWSGGGGYPINGYISDVRFVNGTAVYGISNFTPPTAPLSAITNTQLLLNFTNQAIVDYSMISTIETVNNARLSNVQKKWNSRSMFFDGAGDRLNVVITDKAYDFGTGDFTVEGWFNFSAAGTHDMVTMYVGASATFYFYYFGPSGQLSYFDNNTSFYMTPSYTFTNGQWYHIAWTRASGTMRIFVDGSLLQSSSYTSSISGVTRVEIGSQAARESTASYIDNLRITKGYARYTASFTAPTSPFPRRQGT